MLTILAIGPIHPQALAGAWPEPLPALVAAGRITICVNASLHEAAARVVMGQRSLEGMGGRGVEGGEEFVAILVDAAQLGVGEWLLLDSFRRHKSLPV